MDTELPTETLNTPPAAATVPTGAAPRCKCGNRLPKLASGKSYRKKCSSCRAMGPRLRQIEAAHDDEVNSLKLELAELSSDLDSKQTAFRKWRDNAFARLGSLTADLEAARTLATALEKSNEDLTYQLAELQNAAATSPAHEDDDDEPTEEGELDSITAATLDTYREEISGLNEELREQERANQRLERENEGLQKSVQGQSKKTDFWYGATVAMGIACAILGAVIVF